MLDPWIWPVLLLVLGMGLALMEVFFPSAGILAFLSFAAVVAAIAMGFRQSTGIGMTILAVSVIGVPAVVALAFRWWPHTSMGRLVLLEGPKQEDVLPDDADRRHLRSLVGQIGRAKCQMLPGGVITIDGRTVDAVSEGMAIETGQSVRVIKVHANRVVVRPVDNETPSPAAENPLERPIDSISTDPFEGPRLDNGPESR